MTNHGGTELGGFGVRRGQRLSDRRQRLVELPYAVGDVGREEIVVPGDHQRTALSGVEHPRQAGRRHEVVLEQELDPRAARMAGTTVCVGGARSGALGVPNHAGPRVRRGEPLGDGQRLIGRLIVDDEDLEVAERLRGDARQRVGEKGGAVVGRNADADRRHDRVGVSRRVGGYRRDAAASVARSSLIQLTTTTT